MPGPVDKGLSRVRGRGPQKRAPELHGVETETLQNRNAEKDKPVVDSGLVHQKNGLEEPEETEGFAFSTT